MEDFKDKILGEKKISKKRGQGKWVAIGIVALVLIAFLIALFGNSGNAIDRTWLGDRITGSLGDIIGVPAFIYGLVTMGVYMTGSEVSFVPDFYGSKAEGTKRVLFTAALLVGGFILFWHL